MLVQALSFLVKIIEIPHAFLSLKIYIVFGVEIDETQTLFFWSLFLF